MKLDFLLSELVQKFSECHCEGARLPFPLDLKREIAVEAEHSS